MGRKSARHKVDFARAAGRLNLDMPVILERDREEHFSCFAAVEQSSVAAQGHADEDRRGRAEAHRQPRLLGLEPQHNALLWLNMHEEPVRFPLGDGRNWKGVMWYRAKLDHNLRAFFGEPLTGP